MTLGVINIGQVPVKMACSADTLRQYRIRFGRDLLIDLQRLAEEEKAGEIKSTECVEDLAYIMARQGDPAMEMNIDEWLDQFGPVDVVLASREVLNLWGLNAKETSRPKKK